MEIGSDTDNETKHLYCFVVKTSSGQVHSIQVDTASLKVAVVPQQEIQAAATAEINTPTPATKS